ncbi:hypothetical protein HOC01_06015 [archaeon]|jgi:undecaprenyl phosphate-alpha-L-ara4N flippase subunit ArnE|nr:hypothetical protein [archaeon]MBT6697602.1 hypothetical protein [archaeon]
MELKKYLPHLLMLVCTFFTAAGQIFFKFAAPTIQTNILSYATSPAYIFGLSLYGIGAALFIFALKVGELSQIFPMLALNFIWVALAAVFIFGETLTTIRILATILIAIGVLFVGSNS